jgi:hypothetical protein
VWYAERNVAVVGFAFGTDPVDVSTVDYNCKFVGNDPGKYYFEE